MNDPFAKLSSTDAIKKAYRNLVKSCHPDLRKDKEAAAIEFRELTRIYHSALAGVGRPHGGSSVRPPPRPRKPPPPRPTTPLVCRVWVVVYVESWELGLFGEIIRDIRVTRQILEYGGKIVVMLRSKGHDEQTFEFEVPPQTKNGQKFRFKHPIGIIEIQVVSEGDSS